MISCLVKIQNLGIICVVYIALLSCSVGFGAASKRIRVKAFLSSIRDDPLGDLLCEGIECDRGGETVSRTKIQPP